MGAIKRETQAQLREQDAFNRLQEARRTLKAAYENLVEAHKRFQRDQKTAMEMADGDVRSICGLPHPHSAMAAQEAAPRKARTTRLPGRKGGGVMAINAGAKAFRDLAVTAAVLETAESYERGLDCAGVHSDASYFDGIRHEIRSGTKGDDALLQIFDRYGARNGNREVAAEFLEAALQAAYQAGRAAEDQAI
jgi:hypothetical protein